MHNEYSLRKSSSVRFAVSGWQWVSPSSFKTHTYSYVLLPQHLSFLADLLEQAHYQILCIGWYVFPLLFLTLNTPASFTSPQIYSMEQYQEVSIHSEDSNKYKLTSIFMYWNSIMNKHTHLRFQISMHNPLFLICKWNTDAETRFIDLLALTSIPCPLHNPIKQITTPHQLPIQINSLPGWYVHIIQFKFLRSVLRIEVF